MNRQPAGRALDDYGVANLSPLALRPNHKHDEYSLDRTMNGIVQDESRYDETSDATPTLRSPQVDLKDPIQVHLLTETALLDSQGFEILSQEEVDELKKQAELLSQRVESTRSNLAIQCKYRDAAASMARLGQGGGADDYQSQESERERIECERKCDELASELLELEKRLLIPHRKIVEHTAAILQLTHKASKKKASQQNGQSLSGIPGSPESLYTYSHGRNSLDQMGDETYFDDSSGYQLDGMERARKNAIEIPLKSPIREQNQIRVELDRLREENTQLRSQTDGLLQKLQGLNMSLRETIVRFNPEVNDGYDEPPEISSIPDAKLEDLLKSQTEYLESGLVAVQAEQEYFAGGNQIGERIETINLQLRDLLMMSDPHYTPTTIPPESDVNGQMAYLEKSIRSVDSQLARANSSSSGANSETGPVLTGLWESIQRGFSEAKKRKDDHRRARTEKGLPEDDDDASDDEGFDTAEPYSLEAFADRVQWMHAQSLTLRDQKYVLKRQIKQQRELNNKSDAEKDEELARKQEDLEQSQEMLSRAEQSATDVQRMLSDAMKELEDARTAASDTVDAAEASVQKRENRIIELEEALAAAQDSLASAEKDLSAARSGTSGTEEKIADMTAQMTAVAQAKKAADERIKELETELAQVTAQVTTLTKERKTADGTTKELEKKLLDMTAQVAAVTQEKKTAHEASKKLEKELAENSTQVAAIAKEKKKADENTKKLEKKVADITAQVAALTQQTKTADETTKELKKELAAKTKQFRVKDDEVDQLNMTIAELKTEVTIARAELDGAYGSRAERAAEVAAIKQSSESLKLQNQVDRLKKELSATVEELEGVTRETIGSEKEKADVEAKLDEALAARTSLETELQKARDKMAKLQEELDGERLKIRTDGARPGAGASMLSERFRATMREERKKFQEDLREERTRCRKLEEELSRLKRSQGPGKSPLSPR
ncbi:related to nonmuscle myosin-II heavy chain [Claviceps purpurea 20.1]|uniref:Related to nonmuscle myosin-II heavy chain n=1 Tax=Claviceps purpurea (strain 20.1) TaxID=1111077 RepID=M1VXH5_CLAP2|nr:related to nonmuscle myosin-II heavy chain [Claviceps purpurea 20.1]